MKEETKKQLLRLGVMFAPVFTFIMYLLPWMGYYNESFEGVPSVVYDPMYYSYFDLLFGEIGVYPKIIMWISLIGVVGSLIIYVLSSVFKDKEKLLIKIAAITLVAATGILFLISSNQVSLNLNLGIFGSTKYL